jgi:hypothetical protein
MEGIRRGLIDDTIQRFSGSTEKDYEIHQAGYLVSRPRFEPDTIRIQVEKRLELICAVRKCKKLLIRYGRVN